MTPRWPLVVLLAITAATAASEPRPNVVNIAKEMLDRLGPKEIGRIKRSNVDCPHSSGGGMRATIPHCDYRPEVREISALASNVEILDRESEEEVHNEELSSREFDNCDNSQPIHRSHDVTDEVVEFVEIRSTTSYEGTKTIELGESMRAALTVSKVFEVGTTRDFNWKELSKVTSGSDETTKTTTRRTISDSFPLDVPAGRRVRSIVKIRKTALSAPARAQVRVDGVVYEHARYTKTHRLAGRPYDRYGYPKRLYALSDMLGEEQRTVDGSLFVKMVTAKRELIERVEELPCR